jgi:hypothetical protein
MDLLTLPRIRQMLAADRSENRRMPTSPPDRPTPAALHSDRGATFRAAAPLSNCGLSGSARRAVWERSSFRRGVKATVQATETRSWRSAFQGIRPRSARTTRTKRYSLLSPRLDGWYVPAFDDLAQKSIRQQPLPMRPSYIAPLDGSGTVGVLQSVQDLQRLREFFGGVAMISRF